jgi:meso-butanediol dehydrogenase / (S,S)-butanediol dehydrogenase / diacetyl reductase
LVFTCYFLRREIMRLDGKVALITGGGTGIGTAIAERFVADGAKVCITGRRKEPLEEVVRSLPAGSAAVCAGDVSNIDDAKRMVEATVAFGGKIDVLVNNAAIDPGGTITDIDPELWRQVLAINLNGPFYLMKFAIPYMMKIGGGSIINIASLAGTRCLPGMPAYCSSKAGLIMLTQQAAVDYGPHNIRSNVVCPGGVRTDMVDKSLGALKDLLKTDLEGVFKFVSANTPLKRFATPEEMGGICSYLASDDSSYMTGSVLLVDGGVAVVDAAGATLNSAGVKWGA